MPARTRRIALLIALVALALPASSAGRPADVVIVNSAPIGTTIENSPVVRLDSEQNTVKIDPSANAVSVPGPVEVKAPKPYHAYVETNVLSSAGISCKSIAIPAGKQIRLDSISATTFNDSNPVVYLRYLARTGNGLSRVLAQRVPMTQSLTDPTSVTRSGVLALPIYVRGGNVFDVALGQLHSLEACHSTSSSGQAFVTLTGTEL